MGKHRRSLVALGLLVLPLAQGSCGGDGGDEEGGEATAPAGIFVGKVEGIDAHIGIKSDGEEAGGYLCNGKKGLAQEEIISVWLDESPVSGDEATLVTRQGDEVGEVTFTADGASGEVEGGGETYSFSAEPARREGGIYREVNGEAGEPGFVETGAVVLADGSFRGAETGITAAGTAYIDPVTQGVTKTGYIDPTSEL